MTLKNIIGNIQCRTTLHFMKESGATVTKEYKEFFGSAEKNETFKKEISLKEITKVYDNGIKAITDLSLNIKPGEFVVLLGPSGCGKTTLLRMIAGLEKTSDGLIQFNGATVNAVVPKDREIAMVFQNYALYPFMSVANNISFGLKNKAFNNSVYRDLEEQIKIAENPNYEELQTAKIQLKSLRTISSEMLDAKLRVQRLLKTAKIYKNKGEIAKYQAELTTIQEEIQAHKTAPETFKTIEKLKAQIAEIKKRGKISKELWAMKSNPKFNELVKQELEKRKQKVNELIDKKYQSSKIWWKYIPHKIEDVTSMLGINMYVNRKPADLSGGQRQRVALARAISKQSGLFLFDEPLSNLDAKLRAKMRIEIRKIHDHLGATSVYVTHDQLEAMSMADKIVVMNRGYIQQVGTPLELLENPHNLFVAKFIGNTDVNIIPVKYSKDFIFESKQGAKIQFTRKASDIDAKSLPKDLVIAFRPEHVIMDPQIVANFKQNKFKGEITSIELLGNEVLLDVDVDKLGTLRIMSNISFAHKLGEKVEFIINPNKLNLFDNKTGFNVLQKFDEANNNAKEVWLKNEEERRKNIFLMHKEKNKLSVVGIVRLKCLALVSKTAREKLIDRKKDIDYGDQIRAS